MRTVQVIAVVVSLAIPGVALGFGLSSESGTPDSKWHIIALEKMELKVAQLASDTRDPYAPEYTGRWRNRAQLDWRVSLLDSAYWDNEVHTETVDTGAVKTVGWHWEAGLRLNKYIIPYWEHHSRHIMDEGAGNDLPYGGEYGKGNQFPVENSYGIRFRFINETTGRSIFD